MMAKRFGGDFRPNSSQETKKPKVSAEVKIKANVDAAGARSNVLVTPAIVVAATSIGKGAIALSLGLASAAALTLGAWLMRDGLRARAAFDARRVARRPAIPRKLFSALALGIGVALAAFRNDGQILASVIYGACAAVLTIAAFGLDPMHDKGMEGIDTHQQDRVARTVDAAEAHLPGPGLGLRLG